MKQVRWGMIGCGDVTEVKSGPAFNKVADSELVAVAGRTPARAKDYASRHGVPKVHETVDDLLSDPDVNAIYVATPPGSHAEYTIRAAAAGKPAYVEKPMACTHADSLRMIEACRQAGVRLLVAYYRRALPKFLKVKELLDGQAIGAVRLASTILWQPPRPGDFDRDDPPWRVLPDIAGGGYFVDLAPHQLDLFDYLFGPIMSVSGYAVNQAGLYPAEDLVCASYRFRSGVVGIGSWCFTVSSTSETDRTEIIGERGTIAFATFGSGAIRLETAEGAEEFDLPTPENIQLPLIRTVVDDLLGRGKCPSPGESAARTDWVIDRILGRDRSRAGASQAGPVS